MKRLTLTMLLLLLATAARADNFDIPDAKMLKPLGSPGSPCDMNQAWVDADGARYNAVCCELGQSFALLYRRAPQVTGTYEGDLVSYTYAVGNPTQGCMAVTMACCVDGEDCTAQTYGDPAYVVIDHTGAESRRTDSFSGLAPGDLDADEPGASCSVIYTRVTDDDPGSTCVDDIGTDLLCFIQGNFGG